MRMFALLVLVLGCGGDFAPPLLCSDCAADTDGDEQLSWPQSNATKSNCSEAGLPKTLCMDAHTLRLLWLREFDGNCVGVFHDFACADPDGSESAVCLVDTCYVCEDGEDCETVRRPDPPSQ